MQILTLLHQHFPQYTFEEDQGQTQPCLLCISPLCVHSQPFVLVLCAVQEGLDSWHLPNPQSCLRPSPAGCTLHPTEDKEPVKRESSHTEKSQKFTRVTMWAQFRVKILSNGAASCLFQSTNGFPGVNKCLALKWIHILKPQLSCQYVLACQLYSCPY